MKPSARTLIHQKRQSMPTTSRPAARLAFAVSLLVASVALTGCSQVSAIVDQILPERSGAHRLVVGDCFNNTVAIPSAQDAVVDVPRENCTLAHDNEVIASIELEGEDFPGDDALLIQGGENCLPEFEAFIGVGFAEAGPLAYDFFVPSAASWQLGDRELLCFVYDSTAQTAYTLAGSGAERATAPEITAPEPEPGA